MTPVELSRTVLRAVRRAVDAGELSVTVPERVVVAPPGPGGCGDYATNIALQLARPSGRSPREVAEVLRPYLLDTAGLADVVITGPGFLNIRLHSTSPAALVEEILRSGPEYGHADALSGQIWQLHAAHEVRALVVADATARLLRSQGALVRVTCEARPEPQWESVLGARADAYGTFEPPAPREVNGLPFPAPAALTPEPPAPHEVNLRSSPALADPTPSPSTTPRKVNVRPLPAPADPAPLGRDAGRWALLYPAAHDRPRVSADEHLVQREANPLFRVRYAHARTRALVRNAADLGFHADPGGSALTPHPTADTSGTSATAAPTSPTAPTPLTPTPHTPLLTPLADHPRILTTAATHHTPDRLARHLVTVADAALPFLPTVLPRGGEKPSAAHRARLALAVAVGAVLAGGLFLLGIDAPEHL